MKSKNVKEQFIEIDEYGNVYDAQEESLEDKKYRVIIKKLCVIDQKLDELLPQRRGVKNPTSF